MWSECDVVLRDGAIAHLRPVAAGEGAALHALHARLSDRNNYFRFFTFGRSSADRYVDHLLDTSDPSHGALVALIGDRLVGVAGYERLADPARAEIAFAVEEGQHGRGVGTLLLEHLAAYARDHGVTTFVAQIHARNTEMLQVFTDAGFPVRRHRENEIIDVTFPVALTENLLAAQDRRERAADVRSLRALLRPGSVAVIGASRRPHTAGHEVLRALLAGGFAGSIHVVNPHAAEVVGVAAVPRVRDLPNPVDLAVVAVPTAAAAGVIDECASAGVRAVVMLTGGFAAERAAGRAREADLVARARAAGMRLVGPDSLGVLNTAPGVRLHAVVAGPLPRAGRIGVVSQSGGLGLALLAQAEAVGLGLSTFVSTGDKVDVSGNDLLLWAEMDPGTRVVALSLESFGNPRKFARIARRVARTKPIVALRGDRSGPLLRQAGVIAVDGLGELLDTAALLAHQPLPAGRRLAVVGTAAGACALAAEAAGGAGLTVAALSPASQAELRAVLPTGATVAGPVDATDEVGPTAFEKALRIVLADPGVDGVLAVIPPAPPPRSDDLPGAVRAAATHTGRPVLAVLLGQLARVRTLDAGERAVCAYSAPRDAVRAFAHAAGHAAWLGRRVGVAPELSGLDHARARGIVDDALGRFPDGCRLTARRAGELLAAYGIPTSPAVGGDLVVPVTGPAVQTLLSATQDPAFGPLVTFGLGGILTEPPADRAYRLLPLTDVDADELVGEPRGAGAALGRNRPAMRDVLLRVARLAEEIPELRALELLLLVVAARGAIVVADVSVDLAPAARAVDPTLRRLR
jgi:acyl-CoA synthetase (NDP forming)/GNAT superfamily N-acetyltransferase